VLELSRRSGRSCALLFVDLDDFKAINDTRGHAVGDLVLQAVARTIVGAVRQVDTVARLAGDEFTVLCENVDSEEAALQIVTKLQHAFEPPLDIDGEPLAVRASIGLSLFPRDAQDARTLMASADRPCTASSKATSAGCETPRCGTLPSAGPCCFRVSLRR